MLKKSYILNFIIDAKFKYKIKYLFLFWDWEAWCLTQSGGGITPPAPKETLLEIRGGNIFTA